MGILGQKRHRRRKEQKKRNRDNQRKRKRSIKRRREACKSQHVNEGRQKATGSEKMER